MVPSIGFGKTDI